jgi:hypothetical protein
MRSVAEQDVMQRRHQNSDSGDKKMKKMIVNHWRGDYSVGQSFWLHYVLAPTVLIIVVMGIAGLPGQPNNARLANGFLPLQLIVWIWALVGTLRATKNAQRRQGKSLGTTAVRMFLKAKVFVIFAALSAYFLYFLLFLLFVGDGPH